MNNPFDQRLEDLARVLVATLRWVWLGFWLDFFFFFFKSGEPFWKIFYFYFYFMLFYFLIVGFLIDHFCECFFFFFLKVWTVPCQYFLNHWFWWMATRSWKGEYPQKWPFCNKGLEASLKSLKTTVKSCKTTVSISSPNGSNNYETQRSKPSQLQ